MPPIEQILVIDEIPLISVGLQEVFRSIRPTTSTEYAESAYTVLSARKYEIRHYDLIILGTGQDRPVDTLFLLIGDIRQRFPNSQLFIYTDQYYPTLIDKLHEGLVDAIVHKHETADEIRKTYEYLSQGKTYLSTTFQTLYSTYRLYR